MGEQKPKSFWKKYEVAIIAVATLLAIYLLIVFNQKVSFLLGNELIVYLTPSQKSLDMHYGDIKKAEFDVSIDNAANCKASCSYSFTDRSRNETIDNGNFELAKDLHFTKSYGITVKRLGSGQDLYSFDVKCRSVKSITCLTKGEEKSRSSLVTVNYDLTETEKQLKQLLKQNVTKLLNALNDADMFHQKVDQKYFELSYKANLQNLSKEKISIDDIYDKTKVSIENLRSIWAVEDYLKLSQLFNESYFATLNSIENSIQKFDSDIESTVKLHNSLLLQLNDLNKNFNELNKITSLVEDNKTLVDIFANIKKFNKLASSFTNNTFNSYNEVIKDAGSMEKEQDLVIENTKIPAANLVFDFEHALDYENRLLCSLKGECTNEISINSSIKDTADYLAVHPSASDLVQNCNSLKNLENQYLDAVNQSLEMINSRNMVFPSTDEFFDAVNVTNDNIARAINNSYYNSFKIIKDENKTDERIIKIAENKLPKNAASLVPVNYNSSANISLYLLSKIRLSDEAMNLLDKCPYLSGINELNGFDFTPINSSISYKIAQRIETNLSDNPPICCVFNDCKPCCNDNSCKNDPKTFPIIFLHGHSFAEGNSPEFSLDAFNKIQDKLQDDGYLNVGIVSLYSKNEQLEPGIWGMSGKPVTVKVSYYYDAFRKDDKYIVVPTNSENIDTYALRLKDLIDIVKERTNKPKVSIIAHSMGGLVARRYMQIFGSANIDKLVMIGTPNKGIAGEVSSYCKLFGENRECNDMKENSIFLNKLNDPLSQPANIKLYMVIGQGCKMDSGDGDGVVLVENAKLDNAEYYFVNGTCGSVIGNKLHTDMLDTDKYPETYNRITEILSK